MKELRARCLWALASLIWMSGAMAADPLAPETRLVAVAGAPAFTEKEFDIADATDLTVTLTDLQTPAAMSSASVVITQADAVAGKATLAPPATSATVNLVGAVGHYTVRVIGAPDAASSFGTFSVCVAPTADPAACIQSASLSGNVSAPGAASDPTLSYVSIDLEVTAAGTYTVSFADQQFPVSLAVAPNLALFQGSVPVSLGIASGTPLSLNAGKYRLLAYAQADPNAKGGLYGINIAGPAVLFDDTLAVGKLTPVAVVTNPAAQSLTLTVSDFAFPAPLGSATAVVTAGAAKLGGASAGAPANFAAPSAPLRVWSSAAAASGPGAYELSLSSANSTLLDAAYGVPLNGQEVYAFLTPSLTAGAYRATVKDFEFPATLQQVSVAVAQKGTQLNSSSAAGSLDFTATAGPALVLVAATPPANGNGLFAVTVASGGSAPDIVFDKTQGVSPAGLFDSQDIVFGTSGGFDVTLADLQFPAQFQDLALVVSRGGSVLGKIFGGGTFSIAATPGTYQLTFIATPAAQQQYGLYGVKMVASAPTVTLTAAPASLVEGESTTLSWTTADAESCTASGGAWSGGKAVGSGTEAVKVASTTTFKLTCTGPGGSTSQSVTVTATAKPASSSGGGGAVDGGWLLALAALVVLRSARKTHMHRS